MSNSTHLEAAIATLSEKIHHQNNLIKTQQEELAAKDKFPDSLDSGLSRLRRHGAILLYLGSESLDTLVQNSIKNNDPEMIAILSRHLFMLDQSPLSPEVRDEIRNAAENGMNKW